jgi:two-component system response regulator
MEPKLVPILMAENDPQDQLLAREALEEARLMNPFHCVEDGEQLMRYLHREPPFANERDYPYPGVILLDLNMPRKDGRTCLREIKTDPDLKHLPVIVLTTSEEEEEVLRSYDLGASSYITKPVDFNQLVNIMSSLGRYWFSIVELPNVE